MQTSCVIRVVLSMLFVATASLTTGCGPKVIDVHGREATITPQVAVVRAHGNQSQVLGVNGRKVAAQWGRKIVVEPGEVKVQFRFNGNDGAAANSGPGITLAIGPGSHEVAFRALPGHEYEIGYPTIWIGRKPYVKDVTARKNLMDFTIDGKPANPGAKDNIQSSVPPKATPAKPTAAMTGK